MTSPPPRTGPQSGLAEYVIGAVMADGLVGPRFAGRYRKTGHPVALEEMPSELVNRPDFVALLAEAGEHVTALDHPNCVAVYDLVRGDDRMYLVTELVRGRSLEAFRAGELLPPATALVIIDSVLAALEGAHAVQIDHGDVCAENVVITSGGEVKLDEFALAWALAADPRTVGWPQVMPPEGLSDGPTPAADVYATAALARLLLTGFSHVAAEATPKAVGAIDEVLARALDEEPSRRIASASSLRGSLAVAGETALGPTWRADADLATRMGRPLTAPAPRRGRAVRRSVSPTVASADAARPLSIPRRTRAKPTAARPRRGGRLVAVLVLLALVAGAAAAVITLNPFRGAPANTGPLVVAPDARLSVSPSSGGCDTTFSFSAKAGISGTGTLVYRWERSDGVNGPDTSLQIGSDIASFDLTQSWRIQGSQKVSGTMVFHLLQPTERKLSQSFTYAC
ncbi:MAG: serine/threonine protein kinase [Candidatus Dormibacteria bacterium]